MAQIAFPPIDDDILRRRNSILEGLAKILPPECLDRRRIGPPRL